MKNCSVCQAEVPEEAKFCPECGASMVSEPETVKEEGEEIVSLETDPEAPAVMRWYYVEDGRSMGPFDQKELFEKLTQKVITPETYVWSKGMKEWTQLHNTKVYQEQAGVFEIPVLEEDGQPIETFQELDLNKDPIEPVLEEPKKEVKTPPFHKEPENETQDWYYVVNGRTVGPFSETVMIHNIHKGVVDGNTYVWKEGYLDWQHLKDTPLAIHLSKATRPNETVLPGQAPYYANYQPGVPIRNIILYLLLTVVTCGIFEFVWLYMVASDLNKLNVQKGQKPIA